MTRRAQTGLGLRFIVGYKLAKAALELLAAALLFFASAQFAHDLRELAELLRVHASAAWSVALADWMLRALTPHRLHVVALAGLLDGILSFVEGWTLHRRLWWGRWLVVAATACLLPFELVALWRHPSVVRLGVLCINVAIVVYLVRRHGATAEAG